MQKVPAHTLKANDVILPPARELQLWMRRHCAEKGLPETALYLTVTSVEEGAPDKNGRWIIVRSSQTAEWIGDGRAHPFVFKTRPDTAWPRVREG